MLELLLVMVLVVLAIVAWSLVKQNRRLRFEKRSLSGKYGKMTEQFMPFLKAYPYDKQSFRFIGSPIDGVQFEDDRIVLVEFKTGSSRLTEKQKRIRELVRKKRVDFEEIRI